MVSSTTLLPVPGVRIGHATNKDALTGCTVIRFDAPALSAVEVRGAAPGTRELDVLAPGHTVQRADAILLGGGSAFGLRAAEGVMDGLATLDRGFPTAAGPVPIVPAAILFDLAIGSPVAPTVSDGRTAFENAVALPEVETGGVGAGTGATWGKLFQANETTTRQGGVGLAQERIGDHTLTAIAVVNAFGTVLTREEAAEDPRRALLNAAVQTPESPGQATTLVAIVTDAPCDHPTLSRVCVAAHDGIARAIVPAHTAFDGDVVFASTVAEAPASTSAQLLLTIAAELATEQAIRNAVKEAHSPTSSA